MSACSIGSFMRLTDLEAITAHFRELIHDRDEWIVAEVQLHLTNRTDSSEGSLQAET